MHVLPVAPPSYERNQNEELFKTNLDIWACNQLIVTKLRKYVVEEYIKVKDLRTVIEMASPLGTTLRCCE